MRYLHESEVQITDWAEDKGFASIDKENVRCFSTFRCRVGLAEPYHLWVLRDLLDLQELAFSALSP